MYRYQFLSSLFNKVILMPAVIAAVNAFNGLTRKNSKKSSWHK